MSEAHLQSCFQRLAHYRSHRFYQAMRIYLTEFSRDSRLPISRIRKLLQIGDYQLLVAEGNGQVLGFALIWISRTPAFVHVDYLATGQPWQGKGIGTALYRWLITHLRDFSPRAQLLTLEVEDNLIPFYQESETHLLSNVQYFFPGPLGPVPMHLMVYDSRNRTELNRKTIQGVIRALYCGLHGRKPTDPLLRKCLTSVPPKASLT